MGNILAYALTAVIGLTFFALVGGAVLLILAAIV